MTPTPTTFRKKYTTCSGRDKPLRYPLMTIRSKQWYTKTSRLPNSFVNVSIGRPPLIRSRQHDHRSDGRWSQNFKYIWLAIIPLGGPYFDDLEQVDSTYTSSAGN